MTKPKIIIQVEVLNRYADSDELDLSIEVVHIDEDLLNENGHYKNTTISDWDVDISTDPSVLDDDEYYELFNQYGFTLVLNHKFVVKKLYSAKWINATARMKNFLRSVNGKSSKF